MLASALGGTAGELSIERVFVVNVEAFDWNCPQHITPRFTMDEVRQMNLPLYEHIEKLEKEIEELKRS